jgi:ATP-dependent DNA helicase RecG
MEESHGFDDTAVVGGLDKFIEIWAEAMAAQSGGPELVRQVTETPYAGMSPEDRRRWACRWSTALNAGLGQTTPGGGRPEPMPPKPSVAAPPAPTRAPKQARAAKLSGGSPTPLEGQSVDAPVDRLRGVDTKLSGRLERLEVRTVRDLIYLFPRRHLDYSKAATVSELSPGQECTLVATVWDAQEVIGGQQGQRRDTEAVLSDETGNIKVIWFGQRYLARTLKPNSRIAISGKVEVFRGQLVFLSPEHELLDAGQTPIHTGRLVPVYPLTGGLSGRNLRRLTWQVLSQWLRGVDELLPEDLLDRTGFMPLRDAIRQAHYPDNLGSWEAARRRLAFDELFILQVAVLRRRQHQQQDVQGIPIVAQRKVLDGFYSSLPFQLTTAQRRSVDEIIADLERGTPPMNRLLQGEVGSGKTVVALAALLTVAAAGHQGAVMVPTEVLAEQHFQTVGTLLSGMGSPLQSDGNLLSVSLESMGRVVSLGLLTGSTRPARKRELTKMAAAGTLDLVIGTHALIQSGVSLPKLALAVADEQHRFGVMQRSALRERGTGTPHTLIMSATPIPRTLTLTLYGDLDISTLDELPAGRQQVSTGSVTPERRQAAFGFIRKQVEEGRQAFVICPLVEESEVIEATAATEEFEMLSQEVFPDLTLGLLHGRMPSKDKDRVMRRFRDGELDILVSTAVVEVGIDVANASVMMIEGAERFGLSQLHQFRGRVGRGKHKSYCILVSESNSELAKERLSAMVQIHDGFRLAEADLELRGPGDFFGTRQSGLPNLRMAHLSDRQLLESARDEATRVMKRDPELKSKRHAALAAQVARFLDSVSTEAS